MDFNYTLSENELQLSIKEEKDPAVLVIMKLTEDTLVLIEKKRMDRKHKDISVFKRVKKVTSGISDYQTKMIGKWRITGLDCETALKCKEEPEKEKNYWILLNEDGKGKLSDKSRVSDMSYKIVDDEIQIELDGHQFKLKIISLENDTVLWKNLIKDEIQRAVREKE